MDDDIIDNSQVLRDLALDLAERHEMLGYERMKDPTAEDLVRTVLKGVERHLGQEAGDGSASLIRSLLY